MNFSTVTIVAVAAVAAGLAVVAVAAPNRAGPGKQVVYKTSGGEEQVMELSFPPGHDPAKAKVPAVLLFHGGGWSGGDLKHFRRACEYFASRGLVAATANYQMHTKEEVKALPPNESRKRVCVTDAKSAIRWIKSHAGELGVDPDRLVTGGGSAGGHICVLAALNEKGLDDPADPPGIDTKVRAFLLFNPAFVTPGRDRDREVDVFEHLDGEMPPFLFLFGTEDGWKPASDQLFETLKNKQKSARFLVATDEDHGFFSRDPWHGLCLAECDALLVSLGLLEGPAPPAPVSGDERLVEVK